MNASAGGRRGPRRAWLALVLLACTVAATIALGRWQLHRAQEKRDLMAAVEAGRSRPPLALDAGANPAALVPWRPAVAHGRWLADRTILLDNRSAAGRPGFWVVTPLLLAGTPSRGTAVAVLRGWLPRAFPDAPQNAIPAPGGELDVRGELLDHVPRLFELPSWLGGRAAQLPSRLPDPSGIVPRVQNLDLGVYSGATGLALLPAVLQQTGEAADGLLRDWPPPPSNVDTHLGYAMQWFSFAAIAAIAFGVILVRRFRPTRP
ncbi:SURF1 family protein [Pigmentiphaga soli]|uniref:SURF1-like protein n=1 Tax=Pigmentiphaga soli TaxID=1007095 RepID=A0ABP8GIF5_9BURK